MKGIFAAIALLPAAAYAQHDASIDAGAFELGGDTKLDLTTGSTKQKADAPDAPGAVERKTDRTVRELNASGFYYVVPNVGLGLHVSHSKESEEVDGTEESVSSVVIGPMITAQLPVAPQVALFGVAGIGYTTGTVARTDYPDIDASGYGVTLEAGLKYFVVKHFSLNAGVTYEYLKLTTDALQLAGVRIPETDWRISSLGVSAGLSVYFGR